MIITRRSLFGLIAAPAIIRVADLMPIKALTPVQREWWWAYGTSGRGTSGRDWIDFEPNPAARWNASWMQTEYFGEESSNVLYPPFEVDISEIYKALT